MKKLSESIADVNVNIDSDFIVNAVIRLMKHDILERYRQTGEITDEDWEFCERIDWHPVDDFPLKEEFIEELRKAREEPSVKLKSVSDIFD